MDETELKQALNKMRQTQWAADRCADTAADLVVGRLRHVSSYTLSKLKRELRDFNIHTSTWSDK